MKFLATLLTTLFLAFPAFAGSLDAVGKFDISQYSDRTMIDLDFGGSIKEYLEKYTAARHSGAQFVVDGPCISACTMIISEVPSGHVCVTDYALFAFHSASTGDGEFAYEATRFMWTRYPQMVKDMLLSLGWDGSKDEPHPSLVYIKGTDLYPLCSNGS